VARNYRDGAAIVRPKLLRSAVHCLEQTSSLRQKEKRRQCNMDMGLLKLTGCFVWVCVLLTVWQLTCNMPSFDSRCRNWLQANTTCGLFDPLPGWKRMPPAKFCRLLPWVAFFHFAFSECNWLSLTQQQHFACSKKWCEEGCLTWTAASFTIWLSNSISVSRLAS
jgi:hypothetical protein